MSKIDYRIPKSEVTVDILVDHWDGKVAEYVLYLSMVSRYRKGPESLFEFLNKDKSFIPIKDVASGQVTILNMDEIMYVEEKEPAGNGETGREVTLYLTHRVTLKLVHFKPMPDAQSRTLDYLNDPSRFIVFANQGRRIFINKNKIVKVQEG